VAAVPPTTLHLAPQDTRDVGAQARWDFGLFVPIRYTVAMSRSKAFDPDEAIDRALELFRLRGYEATAVDDLVAHLGIHRSSLYNTFGSKHALYIAALERYLARPQPDSGAFPLPPARQVIAEILTEQVDEALALAPRGGCLLVNSIAERLPQDRDVAARVQANLAQSEQKFFTLLCNDAALGLAEAESHQIAQMLVNTVLGLRLMAKANPDRQQLLNVVTTTLKALG